MAAAPNEDLESAQNIVLYLFANSLDKDGEREIAIIDDIGYSASIVLGQTSTEFTFSMTKIPPEE